MGRGAGPSDPPPAAEARSRKNHLRGVINAQYCGRKRPLDRKTAGCAGESSAPSFHHCRFTVA